MQLKQRKPIPAATVPHLKLPHAAQRHWQRGIAFAKASDWPRAEQAFRQAVDASPSDPVFLINLARAQLKNEHLDDALGTARTLLAQTPDDAIARSIVAACLNRQHRYVSPAIVCNDQSLAGPVDCYVRRPVTL